MPPKCDCITTYLNQDGSRRPAEQCMRTVAYRVKKWLPNFPKQKVTTFCCQVHLFVLLEYGWNAEVTPCYEDGNARDMRQESYIKLENTLLGKD